MAGIIESKILEVQKMTLDEAIKHAEEVAEQNEWFDKNCLESMQCRECAEEHRQLAAWLKDYKRLLEQQPSDDTISRQAVLDINFKRIILTTAKPAEMIEQKVKALPPVAPKQKGHWDHGKEISREYRGQTLVNINYLDWYCSNCHCVVEQSIKPEWSYCPNCGARMVEPQESEK